MNIKATHLIATFILLTSTAFAQTPQQKRIKKLEEQVQELQAELRSLKAQLAMVQVQVKNMDRADEPNPLLTQSTPSIPNQAIIVTVTSNTAADISGLQEKLDNERINHDKIIQNLEDARDRQVDVSTKIRGWGDAGETEMKYRHSESVRNRVNRQIKKIEGDERRSQGIINRLEKQIERAKKNRVVMGRDQNEQSVHITAMGINAQVAQTMVVGGKYQVSGHQTTAGGVIRITMSSAVPVK